MSHDDLMKKIQGLKDLRQAIELMRGEGLEKRGPIDINAVRAQGKQAVVQHAPALKHIGIRTDKSPGVVVHMIGAPSGDGMQEKPHHYEIDVNMNHIDSKIPAYTVHKIHSGSGQAMESAPEAHKDIGSAVKSLISHAYTGKWKHE